MTESVNDFHFADNSRARIGINAVLLTRGGATVALDKLLSEFVRLRPDLEYHVIADAALPVPAAMQHKSVFCHARRYASRCQFAFAFWHLVALPTWLIRNKIDVLFTHTCYLPPVVPRPTVLLMQDARYFYDQQSIMRSANGRERLSFTLKKSWAFHSVRTADIVTVQSETLRDSIVTQIPCVASRVKVIPHGAGHLGNPESRMLRLPSQGETLELLYVSLFRPYKNFSVLLRALKCLRADHVPARLHLTLDERDRNVRQLMAEARAFEVQDYIVNHGEVEKEKLPELYSSAHVFVFASICESFGFPLVEAMSCGLPVIAADTKINREICGVAAAYFPPDDARTLAYLLRCYYTHPKSVQRAAKASTQRAVRFNWKVAGEETLRLILRQLKDPRAVDAAAV